MEEEIAMLSVKGQVVIPQDIRRRLKLRPKDKLIVYGDEDTIIMKKLDLPELKSTWKEISSMMKERNKKYGKLSQKDINREISSYRESK